VLKVENIKGGLSVKWSFEKDDPRGWVNRSHNLGHLENMLTALGDPMEFADVKATGVEATEQLKAVSWFIDQLSRRQDALIVAQRERGTSWAQLARAVDPDESDPARLRSAMQRKYQAGLRRAGLDPIAGGAFYRNQRVRILAVSGLLADRRELIGKVGTVVAEAPNGQITLSGLSGKPQGTEVFMDYLGFDAHEIEPETTEA